MLMWAWIPIVARDFSTSQLSVQTLAVSGQPLPHPTPTPLYNCMHQHLCTLQNSQTLAAIPLFGHTKILSTLIGMGGTALEAAVPYPGKVTQIPETLNLDTLNHKEQ